MSRNKRLALIAGSGLLLLLAGLPVALYRASQSVPEFYVEAIRVDPARQSGDSHQFLVTATALAGDVRQKGRWQAEIRAAEINGWLAVDRVENHPDLLAPQIVEPRVAIHPGLAKVAFRYEDGGVSAVVSFELEAYMQEPNIVALRIRKARAGSLPFPLGEVLKTVTASSTALGLHVRWLEVDGDPTAWITLPEADDADDLSFQLDTLELRDGALFLSGETTQHGDDPSKLGITAVLRRVKLGGTVHVVGSSMHQRLLPAVD